MDGMRGHAVLRLVLLGLGVGLLASLAHEAEAVTRFYFGNAAATPAVAPTPASGWEDTSQMQRRQLWLTKPTSETMAAGQTVTLTEDVLNNHEMDKQYVTTALATGTTFTSGVTTVALQLAAREVNSTDDVTQGILAVQVWDSTATTLRATLLTVANYGTTTELSTGSTGRNKQFATTADTVTASYTTVAGDILVVEIGFSTGTDNTNTTPEAVARYGGSTTDCAVNETDTNCAGWIEFGNTFTLAATATPATTATPTVSPTPTATRTVTPIPTVTPPTEVYMTGFDACESSLDFSPGGTGVSISSSSPRTGRCHAQVALTSGAAGYVSVPVTLATQSTLCGRVYVKLAAGSGVRTLAGTYKGSASQYGCRVDLDATNNALVARYKDTGYEELGRAEAPAVGTAFALDICTINNSTAGCAADCSVTCSVEVNGRQAFITTLSSVAGADFHQWDQFYLGDATTATGTYTATFDDWVLDKFDHPGVGYVYPLVPITPDQTLKDWLANGGDSGCGSGSRFECVDDYSEGTGTHDASGGTVRASSLNDISDYKVTALPAQGTGETVDTVSVFGVDAVVSTGAGRTYSVCVSDGTNEKCSSAVTPTTEAPTYGVTARLEPWAYKPGGGAWGWSDISSSVAMLRLHRNDGTGTVAVSAVLGYADVSQPTPELAQNLQDWNGDGRLTIAAVGDSVTNGTGLGLCQKNASAGFVPADVPGGTTFTGQCSQNIHCRTCSNDITAPCESNSDCSGGGTCTDYGPCGNSGKYPTALGANLPQTIGGGTTTVLNCGIGGNTLGHLDSRIDRVMDGVGLPGDRHCMTGTGISCTPDNETAASKCVGGSNAGAACSVNSQCPSGMCVAACGSSKQCHSLDCGTTRTAYCATSCELAIGTKVCSNSHATECSSNVDCSGGGTCTDYPAPDYVLVMIGGNDLRFEQNADCNIAAVSYQAPCPPQATVAAGQPTPAVTPTPPAYHCQRVSCQNNADCGLGATGGLCSNDFTKGCDADGDCTPGTCNTAIGLTGSTSQCTAGSCSVSTWVACSTDAGCPRGETCNTSAKFCSCPCMRIKCTQDSDCQQGVLTAIDGVTTTTVKGSCVSGKCKGCGPPGSRLVCTGDNFGLCRRTSDCTFAGGTCGNENPRYWDLRKTIDAAWWRTNAQSLRDTIEAAGARLVWMIYPPASQDLTWVENSNWYTARDDLQRTRWTILNGDLVPNAVDTYTLLLRSDRMVTPKRCVASPTTLCSSNADCPSSGECATLRSTMRAKEDPIHFNAPAASLVGNAAADYLTQLSPVCSGDPTTGCGRCSITTTTKCLSSADCPAFSTGEKCLATASVCSGAGKGTCTAERACWSTTNCTDHGLCTWDLMTKCQSNADCSPASTKGICRAEGLPAPGDG